MRAFLFSLIVLACGAALGTGGFFLEQSRSAWRPQTVQTGDGWKISTSHGLRLGAAALGPGHIVWNAGSFTVLTDLTSGTDKLLGARAFAGDLSAPSISERYVTWMDVRSQGADVVWVYDMHSGRRVQLEELRGVTRSPVLAGSVAVWAGESGDGLQVRAADLVTGRRSTIADTPVADDLVAGGDLAAWLSRVGGGEPPVITVADVRSGLRREVAPFPATGGRLVGFAVTGRSLVWARDAGAGSAGQLLAINVDSGATTALAAGPSITSMAAGDGLVVWTVEAPGGGARIMGLRLAGGGAFTVALLPGDAPVDVYAWGDTAAWRVSPLAFFASYLQTATVSDGRSATTPMAHVAAVAKPVARSGETD